MIGNIHYMITHINYEYVPVGLAVFLWGLFGIMLVAIWKSASPHKRKGKGNTKPTHIRLESSFKVDRILLPEGHILSMDGLRHEVNPHQIAYELRRQEIVVEK